MLSSFMLLFKPSIVSLIIGGVIVASAAILAENFILRWTSELFLLLIAAPVLEETFKLIATSYGKGIGNAIGVGTGFAIAENVFYLMVVLSSYSATVALTYILARGLADPLLHSTSTSISIKAWNGKMLSLPKAIGLHFMYNLWAILIVSFGWLFSYEPVVIVLLLTLFLFETGKIHRGNKIMEVVNVSNGED